MYDLAHCVVSTFLLGMDPAIIVPHRELSVTAISVVGVRTLRACESGWNRNPFGLDASDSIRANINCEILGDASLDARKRYTLRSCVNALL
jgi:hypothetical protein